MKKFLILVFAVMMTMNVLCGCNTKKEDDGELTVLCTIFPVYDWVCELTKGAAGVKVELLMDSGTDMHNYQVSAADILSISRSDVFIYVGGESDAWVSDALENAADEEKTVINLMELLGDAKLAETDEGIVQGEHGEGEADGHEHHGSDEVYDEHIWLSLKNAEALCKTISVKLSEADVNMENDALYEKNAEEYVKEINALDAEYQEAVSKAAQKTLIFGGRFPFIYLVNDYGLDYYAAFSGCSAETEASFDTVIFIAEKMDGVSCDSILCIKGDDVSLCETVIENTASGDKEIVIIDSMQDLSKEDIENGTSFMSVMESNLDSLKKALN